MTEQEDLRIESDDQKEPKDQITDQGRDPQQDFTAPEEGQSIPSWECAAEDARAETGDSEAADASKAESAWEEEVRQLRQQLEAAREEAEANYQRFLRTQADFDNFRRRTRQEKEEMAKYAAADLIAALLPVMDNFDRAIAAAKETDPSSSLFQGLEMVYKQFKDVLAAHGLEEMDCIGKPFDPFQHEAVMREPSEEHEEGIVLDVLQKGYRLKDRVIRPAMVKVSG